MQNGLEPDQERRSPLTRKELKRDYTDKSSPLEQSYLGSLCSGTNARQGHTYVYANTHVRKTNAASTGF